MFNYRVYFLLLTLLLFVEQNAFAEKKSNVLKKEPWAHIELGAVNRVEQTLRERGAYPGQYILLEKTIDELVAANGGSGTIYLNDLKQSEVEIAVERMRYYSASKGYFHLRIVSLPGNIFKIKIPKVDSIHLKNPSLAIMEVEDVGSKLQEIANHSRTGILVSGTSTFVGILEADLRGQISKTEREDYPYYFPKGGEDKDIRVTNVLFSIKPQALVGATCVQKTVELVGK
ncbi:MAG: hypothetical protein JWQ35_2477 [Bacteriovoracaceae bacterium]|nr:hypothetical protein [Bacteriovoracaceae bacterium]